MTSTPHPPLPLTLDKSAAMPLTDQIHRGISAAIEQSVLTPGMRLPSWIDLAAQLGVSRGTVRVAYEKLAADQLIEASRAAGTRVAERPSRARGSDEALDPGAFVSMYRELTAGPGLFQPGIPSRDSLPAKLMARLRTRALAAETSGAALYPDPRGELALRREIAGYLAVARGLVCSPDQVLVTGGYAAGLGLVLRALGLEGRRAWMEEPGFFFTRHALELGRLTPVPVLVDEEGLDVDAGWRDAPDAALAVVTPGQQAPLGVTMSLRRRLRLLDWAASTGGWIVEDDYLSELQLQGRAAPALASLDRHGRVLHIGSFSKTIDPRLRLGFVVAPASLAARLTSENPTLAPDLPDDSGMARPPAAPKRLSILVAEDNEINALLMRSLLAKLGHEAVICTNGREALESWIAAETAGARYDVVLMDVQMPEMNGIEATRMIRTRESERGLSHTKILALTANTLVEDRYACFEAGMDGFLVKPLDRDKLADALAAIPASPGVAV